MIRSSIIVMGASREKFAAAISCGADMVMVDLEDTVDDKEAGRELVREFISKRHGDFNHCVRINGLNTLDGLKDMIMIAESDMKPDSICIPRFDTRVELDMFADIMPDMPVIAIVERPQAVENVFDIVETRANLVGIFFGGKDYSIYARCGRSWEGLRYARARTASAASIRGIMLFDEPYRPLEDLEGLHVLCQRVQELGFTGKTTIVPEQVPVINRAFGEETT